MLFKCTSIHPFILFAAHFDVVPAYRSDNKLFRSGEHVTGRTVRTHGNTHFCWARTKQLAAKLSAFILFYFILFGIYCRYACSHLQYSLSGVFFFDFPLLLAAAVVENLQEPSCYLRLHEMFNVRQLFLLSSHHRDSMGRVKLIELVASALAWHVHSSNVWLCTARGVWFMCHVEND